MVARAEFIQKVKEFIEQNGALNTWLNEKNKQRVQAFLADPVIHGYLTRHSSSIEFVDKHPRLIDTADEAEFDSTDYYELLIYKLLPEAICYRNNEITSAAFYTKGADLSFMVLLKSQRDAVAKNTHIKLDIASNIHSLPEKITFSWLRLTKPSSLTFIVTPQWKDSHATTLLTILDPLTQRPLVTIFINSWNKEEYFKDMAYKFKQSWVVEGEDDRSARIQNSQIKKQVLKTFKVTSQDLSAPQEYMINKADKSALVTSYKFCDQTTKRYEALRSDQEIDLIYQAADSKTFSLEYSLKSIPFIDASHNLQTADDDGNCVLYSYNISQAIVNLLEDDNNAKRILELARAANNKDTTATAELINIFQNDLKPLLPCYYAPNGEARTQQELEDFHLRQRWDSGSQSLKDREQHFLVEFRAFHKFHYETKGFCGGFFNRTNLTNQDKPYDKLTVKDLATHAAKKTFFGCKNRTRLILEEMGYVGKEDRKISLNF